MATEGSTGGHLGSPGAVSTGQAPARLRKNAIGVWGVVFLVVASAAPLTSMLGGVAPAVGIGNGIGAPGAWLLTGIVLLLFAVGYAAMTRHVTNAGAFYAYIAQGLGRPAGVGAAWVALLSYNVIQAALFGLFGFFAVMTFEARLGISLGWEVYAFGAMALVLMLGYLGISLSAKVLGVLLIAEVVILLIFDVAVITQGGADGLAFNSFSPSNVFEGAPGVAFIFAFATFVGFEATAIYGEETKDPKRTTPRATYIAVALIAVFYTVSTWAGVQAWGEGGAVAQAQTPEGLFLPANAEYVSAFSTKVMEWLLLGSIFAALLAFHNAAARYFFVMGREGLLPRGLASTHKRFGSPHIANFVQIAFAAVVVAAFAIAKEDPYAALFAWCSGVAAVGIIGLQMLTSVSVIAFFRRNGLDRRPWNTVIAPALGALGLAAALYLSIKNFDVLTGAPSDLVKLLWVLVPIFFVGGLAYAFVVRGRNAQQYERLGHFIDESPSAGSGSGTETHRVPA